MFLVANTSHRIVKVIHYSEIHLCLYPRLDYECSRYSRTHVTHPEFNLETS